MKSKRHGEFLKPRTRIAQVYKTSRFVYFESRAVYVAGYPDPQAWFKVLPPDADAETLGAALYTALRRSRYLEPKSEPELFKRSTRDGLQKAQIERLTAAHGVKTKWTAFRRMMHCKVWWRDGVIEIHPMHHLRSDQWSYLEGDPTVDISELATDAMIGAALNRAFDQCLDYPV